MTDKEHYFQCPYCKLTSFTFEQAERHAHKCAPAYPHFVEHWITHATKVHELEPKESSR